MKKLRIPKLMVMFCCVGLGQFSLANDIKPVTRAYEESNDKRDGQSGQWAIRGGKRVWVNISDKSVPYSAPDLTRSPPLKQTGADYQPKSNAGTGQGRKATHAGRWVYRNGQKVWATTQDKLYYAEQPVRQNSEHANPRNRQDPSFKQSVKQTAKQGGRWVKRTTKTTGKSIGRAATKAGKAVGSAATNAVRAVGDFFR